ncbi:unnamed protein product [Bursaphelenchus xylophilus]|uniref:Chloride channel protein n=1 Tax=Bursaphelenchus xylophilus TaxID=6326 RepID=A0A1I7S5C8_BURXY|nr:unnamed protein product [Bursaphelenchus xylophilus]CAG9117933.1 unnamed protein product [Bursaphelenchus xylophilus]
MQLRRKIEKIVQKKFYGSDSNGKLDESFYRTYSDSFYSSDKKERWKELICSILNWIFNDWVVVILLGCGMAFCSIALDAIVDLLSSNHISLMKQLFIYDGLLPHFLSVVCWAAYMVILVTCSALFAHYVAPQAIGSGIPEMKTILRGVVLKEYLTFRTFISKFVGLTLALASGLPIGKEGPFVHIASIVANILSRLVQTIDPIYANESRHTEMLAAGCAVGVACVFSAPVGGVLFSIEVTSSYFAIRNYWRGFLAAACAASVFRLTKVLLRPEEKLVAVFQTYFPQEAFVSEELLIFAFMGVICGVFSAIFIMLHRNLVLFLRNNKWMIRVFQKHWLTYTILVSFVIALLTYPRWYGAYMGGFVGFSKAPHYLFFNCTWTATNESAHFCNDLLLDWLGGHYERDVFDAMIIFLAGCYFLTILSLTLPIPCGVFGPSFIIGAAFGRLMGELTSVMYPDGFRSLGRHINPGAYAVVGAAAFSGGVTHTISVAVIAFELTGQIVLILPVMIASLISNAICSNLQPSFYDSVILVKHLPYLPDIPSSSRYHGILARQFMTSIERVWYLCKDTTYKDIQHVLMSENKMKVFPVVESKDNKVLIGSCSRSKLMKALDAKVGPMARKAEAAKQIAESINDINRRFRPVEKQRNSIVFDKDTKDLLQEKHVEFDLADTSSMDYYYDECPKTLTRRPSRFVVTPAMQQTSTEEKLDKAVEKLEKKRLENLLPPGVGELFRTITLASSFQKQRKTSGYDLHGKERHEWEQEQLNTKIDWKEIGVDPAPFQLVDDTSLLKVHFLFSLLGLTRSYVTHEGRLVGIISLRDIGAAIEKIQTGQLTPTTVSIYEEIDEPDEAERRNLFQKIRHSVSGTLWPQMASQTKSVHDNLSPPLVVVDGKCGWGEAPKKLSMISEVSSRKSSETARPKMLSSGSDPCLSSEPNRIWEEKKTRARAKSVGWESATGWKRGSMSSFSGSEYSNHR